MNGKYILGEDGKTPIAEPDLLKWAAWFETADRKVAQTNVGGKYVSTVFLGVDHQSFSDEEPLFFETMVFSDGDSLDLACRRYSTWDEALAGHQAMVERVKSGMLE